MKKIKVTKEFLERLGFTRCDEDGQLWKGDYKQTYVKIWARHKYGRDKYYWAFPYYDSEYYAKQMIRYKEGKIKTRPSGVKMMLVSRAVYAWFNGETPDGLDICHRDDEPDNNYFENLVALTHGDNIRNRKIQGSKKTNYYTVNGLVNENEENN